MAPSVATWPRCAATQHAALQHRTALTLAAEPGAGGARQRLK